MSQYDEGENQENVRYQELINIIKGNGRVKSKEFAYNEIEEKIKPKIYFIIKQFYIPGCNQEDILQEALYVLRYKAVIDYDRTKGRRGSPYPFDKFAILCIRRHLSTLLKSSFQNKKRALNTSLSLDQDRNNSTDDSLFLSDIIPRTDGSIGGEIADQEYFDILFKKLYSELSILEKRVFKLYTKKYSYDEISEIINKFYKKKNIRRKTNIKSIDNALSRIKQKGKEIFRKYGVDDLQEE